MLTSSGNSAGIVEPLHRDQDHPLHDSAHPESQFRLRQLRLHAPLVHDTEPQRWITDVVQSYVASLSTYSSSDVLVVAGPPDAVRLALMQLRSQEQTRECLIFVEGSRDAWSDALADGPLPRDPATLQQCWLRWHQRHQRLMRLESNLDGESAVGRWFWLRPEAWLQPVLDLGDPNLYRYPLLEALLAEPSVNAVRWLERRRRAGFLEDGELVDRLRQCQRCQSSQLNYVDICPHCRSLEIKREPCLHCFVCGHVGPQQTFLHADQLQCPNCHTQLRHIGTDYDRPLEHLHCLACDALLLDAAVDARCLSCGKHQHPADLHVREIRLFRLNSTGRLPIRGGQLAREIRGHTFASSILVGCTQFQDALSWQISICRERRAGGEGVSCDEGASLLVLQLINESESGGYQGDVLDRMIDDLACMLPGSSRLFQARDDLFWLLRPCSGSADLQAFRHYLCSWFARQADHALSQYAWRAAHCLIPEELQPNDRSESLQQRLLEVLAETPKISGLCSR